MSLLKATSKKTGDSMSSICAYQESQPCCPGRPVIRVNIVIDSGCLASKDLIVAIISGLSYDSDVESDLRTQNLFDYLVSNVLDDGNSIDTVVFCGNSLRYSSKEEASTNVAFDRPSISSIVRKITVKRNHDTF